MLNNRATYEINVLLNEIDPLDEELEETTAHMPVIEIETLAHGDCEDQIPLAGTAIVLVLLFVASLALVAWISTR